MKIEIIKIMQRDRKWIDVLENNYEIKILEIKKNKPFLHLVYNNDITFRIRYICNNCKKEIETSWQKFVYQQIRKNKCLCHKCSIKTEENCKKISIATKIAMQRDDVKQNHSNAQKIRFTRKEEREKSVIRSIEIINRDEMKDLISKNTKFAMSKIDTKTICNSTKNMNEDEKIEYRKNVGKKISENYNAGTKLKYIITRKNNLMNSEEAQEKYINSLRNKIIKRKSQLQILVENYIRYNLNLIFEEEFPINLYKFNCDYYEFMLIDIVFIKQKIAIEVLGNYFHQGFIEYYFNNINEQELFNRYTDKFNVNRLKKDLYKHNYFINNGWKVLYITQTQIFNENWKIMIDDFLKGEIE